MKKIIGLSLALVALAIGLTQKCIADAVVDWNVIASQAINAAARPGGSGGLDFAMVHAAIYDAVEAYNGRFEPYAVGIAGASGSPAAATARAAHDVLVNRFPTQAASLDTAYHAYLASNGLAEDDPGVSVGQQAAAGIIALRADDGSWPAVPEVFIGGTDIGDWRPTPTAFAPMAVPWLATVTPFTLRDPSQFRAPPPPRLQSRVYARDYNEVKAMGAFVNSARTQSKPTSPTSMPITRSCTGTGPFKVSRIRISTTLATVPGSSLSSTWRWPMVPSPLGTPNGTITYGGLTAIQEGDNDGNRWTAGDSTWQPLILNPPYPDYSSGANSLSGSATRMLALFFGTDEVTFSFTSNFPLAVQKTRTYSRFSDAADDVVDARVYLGIHFRFADTMARKQGRHVADWAFKHYLRPLDDGENDDDKCQHGHGHDNDHDYDHD